APLHLEALEDRALPSVLTVNKLFDAGPGTLRQALLDANSSTGPDTIRFDVGGTINLQTQLPALNDSTGGILIDGTTVPGFGTVPLITLHGPGTGRGLRGLLILSANNTVRALQLDSFNIGIEIAGAAAASNVLTGCYLGTNGSAAVPNNVGL